MLMALLLSLALCQQPGEIGAYQGFVLVDARWAVTTDGCKLVPGHWAVAALFCDGADAQQWYLAQPGTVKVVDPHGNMIFSPKTSPVVPQPAQPAGPMVGQPLFRSYAARVDIHARAPRGAHLLPAMPDAIHSRTKIPGVGYVKEKP